MAVTNDSAEESRCTRIECGIAVEDLVLSAMGLGLGPVIITTPDIAFSSEKGAYFKRTTGSPEQNSFVVGIEIGHNSVTGAPHKTREGRCSIV